MAASPLASAFREVAADLESQWAAEDELVRYRSDPVAFCEDVLGFQPWSKQRAVLEAVRDNRRVAVRSCHGVGKTAAAAWTLLWFHATHPNSRIISTAPTFEPGVKDLLWREVRGAYNSAGQDRIGGKLFDTRVERGEQWFAAGYSTDKPERFQGHHAEHLLLIVDEASGVDQEIFDAAEGFLTSENAKVLLIGNPTQQAGQFHSAFHKERRLWQRIHISAFDAPWHTGEKVSEAARRTLITEAWVEEKRQKWGEGTPLWQVRVLGDFSTVADDTVIALTDVEAAHARVAELHGYHVPRVVACDVARFGSDETVIVRRCGQVARIAETYVGKDTTQTAGALIRHAKALDDVQGHDVTIVVDDAGVGGGVTDQLRGCGFRVIAFNGGQRAHDESEYPNRRSEAWFSFADLLPELDLDEDDQLAADLVAPKYKLDSRGRRVLEPKDDTKKRLGRSPDRGDAIVMAFAPSPPAHFDVDRPEGERPGVLDPGLSYGMTF